MKSTLLLGGVCVMMALVGCDMHIGGSGVKGSGKMKSETRTVSDFTSITNDGVGQITVKVGDQTSLKITADDNLLPLIETEVKGGELVISNKENFRSSNGIKIEITTPSLAAIENNGVGGMTISGVAADKFEMSLDGVGSVEADGKVNELIVSVDGVGSANLYGLEAKNVIADTDGVGSIEVTATESLDAKVNGVGSINYRGNPKKITRTKDGVGNISQD